MGELMSELLNLVKVEVEETALNYETARLKGGSLPYLPPYIQSIGWSAPRPELSISDTYIQLLSDLCSFWIQQQIPLRPVRVHHVLLHHGMLEGNTYPLINIGDHNDYHGYHRLSEKGRFANVLCSFDRLRVLGNILAVCGLRVSGSKQVHGAEVFSIATQAPFCLGWYLDRCKHLFRDVILVPIIRDSMETLFIIAFYFHLVFIFISSLQPTPTNGLYPRERQDQSRKQTTGPHYILSYGMSIIDVESSLLTLSFYLLLSVSL